MTWKQAFAEMVRVAWDKGYGEDIVSFDMDSDADEMKKAFEEFFGERFYRFLYDDEN